MKLNILQKRFDDNIYLYSPDIYTEGVEEIAEKTYPAVAFLKSGFTNIMFIDAAEIGEFEELDSHLKLGLAYDEWGGKEKIIEALEKKVKEC